MDVFNGFNPAISGMAAERKRMEIISMNLANANTIGANGPYVRKSLMFEEAMASAEGGRGDSSGGVRIVGVYEDKKSEHPRVFDPGHPAADSEGFVRRPNVNIMFELVDLMVARRSYAANIAAFQAYRSMVRNAISQIGAR